MDAETERWFQHIEKLITELRDDFNRVVSGQTPCEPALQIARLNGRVKFLRLLWIPLTVTITALVLKMLIQ